MVTTGHLHKCNKYQIVVHFILFFDNQILFSFLENTVATSSVPTECSAICIGENHDIGHDDSDISKSESGN